MIKTLLNPFEKHQEYRLLLVGVLITVMGSLAAYFCNTRYVSTISVRMIRNVQIHEPFIDNAVNVFSLCLFIFIVAKIINRKTRFIDILNSVLIARIPLYILTLGNAGHLITSITDALDPTYPEKLFGDTVAVIILLIFGALALTALAAFFILLYNGFRTASNSKQNIHILYFAIAIIMAEILSSYLISIISL